MALVQGLPAGAGLPALRTACASVLLLACVEAPTAPGQAPAPVLVHTQVSAGPHNVLSLVVAARVRYADSVTILMHPADGPADAIAAPPAIEVHDDEAHIPVLGLQPGRTYVLRVQARGPGGTVAGPGLRVTTDTLPSDLPRYAAGGPDPTPGFLAFAAGNYGIVIDNTGGVVWYRQFPHGAGLNFMAQPTGRYVVRPPTPDPGDTEPWLELDALGNVTRTLGCARGLASRFHDLISEPDGSYWILCDDTRTMNLSAMGGMSTARVTGTAIQHVSANGALLFEWNPFDHLAITDLEPAERTGAVVNWTHGNSFDFDEAGDLLVSFRSLGEITKIDARTGAVVWRLGGRRNQFSFLGTPVPAFLRQHSVRATADGRLLLLDNVGDPDQSRVERYVIDDGRRTARLERSSGAGPGFVTAIGGSVQDLPGGRTLAAFGTAGRVVEYDAAGRVVWSITGDAGYVFRAQRIHSLYAPGAGTAR